MLSLEGTTLYTCLLLFSVSLGQVLHHTRFRYATEGSAALLVGLVAGGIVMAYCAAARHSVIPKQFYTLDAEVILNAMLPPIIFQAGFASKKRLLFKNFSTLALLGIVGTFISAGLLAVCMRWILEALSVSSGERDTSALALACIFSATDSVAALQVLNQEVNPQLHSLVFGEGVVNDATSIVLLRALQNTWKHAELSITGGRVLLANFVYLFLCSLLLGTAVGLASAALIRLTFRSPSTDREVCVVALCAYLAYAAAELAGLSGVFATFFAGITMSHYTWHNLSPSAQVLSLYIFRVASSALEVLLFLYCGFQMVGTTLWDNPDWAQGKKLHKVALLAGGLVGLVTATRAAFVLPLCGLANLWRGREQHISARQAAVIWWAGLPRGAITIALAFYHFSDSPSHIPQVEQQVLLTACVLAVICSTLGTGMLTQVVLASLLSADHDLATAASWQPPTHFRQRDSSAAAASLLDHHLQQQSAGMDEAMPAYSKRSYVHQCWRHFDHTVMQRLFGGSRHRRWDYGGTEPLPVINGAAGQS